MVLRSIPTSVRLAGHGSRYQNHLRKSGVHKSRTLISHQRRNFFFGGSSASSTSSRQQSHRQSSSSSSGFFEKLNKEDAGLRWTAVLSNPAAVEGPEGVPSRNDQLQRLQDDDSEYDVLVIGGGAAGAGIALDAARRGLRTACIERGDFASETSSRSTKLIWAGLKYLGTACAGLLSPKKVWDRGLLNSLSEFRSELLMVYHCHVERHYMTTQNRHLCYWVPIAVPFGRWILDPPPLNFPLFGMFPLVAPLAFKVYDALSGFSCPPSHVLVSTAALQHAFPQLNAAALRYCSVFYEAAHNDARTNLCIALTAAQQGAHICNYVAAVQLLTEEEKEEDKGRVTGAVVLDRLSGQTFRIRAKHVVFAGGPFTDSLRTLEEDSSTDADKSKLRPAVRGAHGTHLVLPGHLVPQPQPQEPTSSPTAARGRMGLLDCNTSDGRFLFVLPWQNHTLVGTTDVKGPAQTSPAAPADEVEWILKESSKYFSPEQQSYFQPAHVASAWRGWRPLAIDPHQNGSSGAVSRDHVISQHPKTKCWFVAGGKWTTWREMAQDVVDKLVPEQPCTTLQVSLLGGDADGYSDSLRQQVQEKYASQFDDNVLQHLVDTYGGRVWHVLGLCKADESLQQRLHADFPYLQAEVVYACREYACTVEDVLSRRTRLAFLNAEAALEAMPTVAALLQKELQWNDAVTQQQMEAARRYLRAYQVVASSEVTTTNDHELVHTAQTN